MIPSTVSPIQDATSDLEYLNRQFEKAGPKKILAWCVSNIPIGLVQTSAFNIDDLVITDLLYWQLKPNPKVPVIFLDTLHHFPETLELVAKTEYVYDLDLRTYKIPGVDSRQAFAAKYGEALWEKDIEQFHYLTKIEPLQRALTELNTVAWITGRRRDQSPTRADMPIFEWDRQGRLKVNPLAYWTRPESWAYAYEHDLIYNPLHDRGYPSIGDEPLTTKVQEGESERGGRWRGRHKTECGIHL
jgi:phosphoadenosine phosphosulfate reductase